jgi:hypothetical protein
MIALLFLTSLDYISVVVSGVLAKSRNLCKLQVRLCLADFNWTQEQILANTKLIVGPFESLRNVRQPQILGISMGKPNHNAMLVVQRPNGTVGSRAPICSVPPLPTHTPLLIPGMPDFDAYTSSWTRWVSAPNACALTKKPPIRAMFTSFKDFYSDLSAVVPEVTFIQGRHAFLHRARVAREQEDVEAFRHLRNELIQFWYTYLEQEERKKNAMNRKLSHMLDSDVYPSHEWTDQESRRSSKTLSPTILPNNDKGKTQMQLFDNKNAQQRTRYEDQQQQHVQAQTCYDYASTEPQISIDPIDVACFAHVNLSEDWYAPESAGPGPATVNKKRQRRVDSGFSERTVEEDEGPARFENEGMEEEVVYVGKGKGKMGSNNNASAAQEVICID